MISESKPLIVAISIITAVVIVITCIKNLLDMVCCSISAITV